MKYMFSLGYILIIIGAILMHIGNAREIEEAQTNWNFGDKSTITYWYTDPAGNRVGKKMDAKEYAARMESDFNLK